MEKEGFMDAGAKGCLSIQGSYREAAPLSPARDTHNYLKH